MKVSSRFFPATEMVVATSRLRRRTATLAGGRCLLRIRKSVLLLSLPVDQFVMQPSGHQLALDNAGQTCEPGAQQQEAGRLRHNRSFFTQDLEGLGWRLSIPV